jgi:hypothetical protein
VPALDVQADDASDDDIVGTEAVRLFMDRARATKDDFVLSGNVVSTVGVLCRRLDGIPLAIELAAARIRSMSPDDLVARLDQRFKLLTRGSRAALERHQTLRNTIDWSYGLLDEAERRALDRLSVFAGGWDLTAAEGVIADDEDEALDVVDRLGELVDKSLVVADDDPGTAAVRYRLHESIRQYAQEQLESTTEAVLLRRRHAEYYVGWAERAGPHWRGRDFKKWTDAAARDVDNFRAALDWAVETGSADTALRLVAPMTLQGVVGEPALDWAATACAIPSADDHQLFPDVAGWASWGATRSTDFERAEGLAIAARRAQEARGTRRPNVARAFATLEFYRANFEPAQKHAREWIELARSAQDPYELTNALTMLGGCLHVAGGDGARDALEEAVRIAREQGIDAAIVFALSFLAVELPTEESSRAIALLDEAIEIATRLPDLMGLAAATGMKGSLAFGRGEFEVGLRATVEALALNQAIGDVATGRVALYSVAVQLGQVGALEPAAVLIGKADSMGTGHRLLADWGLTVVAELEMTLLEQLGEARVAELAARGAALTFADAVAYARAEADAVLTSTRAS